MIRKVTGADVSALVALQKGVAEENAIRGYGADTPEVRAGRDLSWTWIALEKETPTGFIQPKKSS